MEAILPSIVDSTMLTAARGCLQKYYNEFVLGLRPARLSLDLHAGGVFASTIETIHREVWDKGEPFQVALARGHGTFIQQWGDFPTEDTDLKTPGRMWECVEKYFKLYPPSMDHVQPFYINGRATSEFSFAIPLDLPGFPLHPITFEPFIYTGRADLLGTYKTRICIRDEKTGSKVESNWSEKWDLRAQFQGYCWAAQHSGLDCDTVIIRGIIPYKTKEPAILEAVKFYPRWQIDRWLDETRRTICDIVAAWNEGHWRFNLGDTCTQYGNCPFMPLCTIPDEQRDNWRSNYRVKRWNPLERNPISEPVVPVPIGSASTPTSASVTTRSGISSPSAA
jgi:hypothetical protein